MHKTILLQASHHTRHEWVERRKRKQVVLEELVKLQLNLSSLNQMDLSMVESGRSERWTIECLAASTTYCCINPGINTCLRGLQAKES